MDRTALTRMRELAVTERSELDRLLDETLIAHVGLRNGAGDVMVVPTAWAGVIPFGRPAREPPLPAPDLRPGIPCPPSVTGMADPDRSDLA
jgi:hypothetical protein